MSDALHIVERDGVDRPAHAGSRLNNGSDRRGILGEGTTKLKEFSILRHANFPRAVAWRFPIPSAASIH